MMQSIIEETHVISSVNYFLCQLCGYTHHLCLYDIAQPVTKAQPEMSYCFRDCGLACALMVLKSLGVSCLDMASLRSLCNTTRYSLFLVFMAHSAYMQIVGICFSSS